MFKAANLIRKGAVLGGILVACSLSACSDSAMSPETGLDTDNTTQRVEEQVEDENTGGGAAPEVPQEPQETPGTPTKGDNIFNERD